MIPWRPILFLYRKNRALKGATRFFLLSSIVLGLSALVLLQNFSLRIEKTILGDSKKLLSADYQVQARREFTKVVLDATLELVGARENMIWQTDFVSSVILPDSSIQTASIRALEGEYPYYGDFRTEPHISVESLKDSQGVIVDKSLRARGFKVGQELSLGQRKFKIQAFLVEEPQTVASAFAVGPRVILHRDFLSETGLAGEGSRAFHMLLLKNDRPFEEFKELFRKKVPEAHWRLISPDKANRQAQGVISRIKSFLSIVALCALFLGALGIFMVYRSQLLLRLPHELSLRCIGYSEKILLWAYSLQAMENIIIGSVLGYSIGFALESLIADWARSQLEVTLAGLRFGESFLFAFMVALVSVLVAVYIPIREILKVPVAQALRGTMGQKQGLSRKEIFFILGVALLLILFVLDFNIKYAAYFSVSLTVLSLLLSVFSRLALMQALRLQRFFGFNLRLILRHLNRSWSQVQLFVVTVGLSVFLVLTVLMVGYSLRDQIDLSKRIGVPNIFLLGVDPGQKVDLEAELPDIELVPIMQARLASVDGEAIVEKNLEEKEGREEFLLTREYTLSKRDELADKEQLVEGESLFGEKTKGLIRVSLEEGFASRISLDIGEEFTIQIAGITLPAQVQSYRKVDWFNFRPNFFIIVHPEDIEGAPFNYVGFTRVDPENVAEVQMSLQSKFPSVSVIDGKSISEKLLQLMDRLSFAVFSLGLFSVFSCVFVFVGMLMSKRGEKIAQVALFKAIGLQRKDIVRMLTAEYVLLSFLASSTAFAMATIGVWGLCRFILRINFYWPPVEYLFTTILVLPVVVSMIAYLLIRTILNSLPSDLFRVAD